MQNVNQCDTGPCSLNFLINGLILSENREDFSSAKPPSSFTFGHWHKPVVALSVFITHSNSPKEDMGALDTAVCSAANVSQL